MSSAIVVLLIVFIVPVILNLVTEMAYRKTDDSIYDFCMRPAGAIAIIGVVGSIIFLFLTFITIKAGQWRGFSAFASSAFLLVGLMMILAPVKGFWETSVKGDDIIASRFWLIKEHVKISEIDYCQQGKGGIHVYVKGRRQKALSIDGMCTNISTFEERMEKEGIEIRRLI